MTDSEGGEASGISPERDTILMLATLCAIFAAAYFAEVFEMWGLFGDGNVGFQLLWLGTAAWGTALGPLLAWMALSSAKDAQSVQDEGDSNDDASSGRVTPRAGEAEGGVHVDFDSGAQREDGPYGDGRDGPASTLPLSGHIETDPIPAISTFPTTEVAA